MIVAVVCVMLWSLNELQGAQVQPFDLQEMSAGAGNHERNSPDDIGIRISRSWLPALKSDKVVNQASDEALHVRTQRGLQRQERSYLAGQGAVLYQFPLPASAICYAHDKGTWDLPLRVQI